MRKLLTLSALLLLASAAQAQSFVAQQFYGQAGSVSNLPVSYAVQNAGNLLLLFVANDSPIGVSDTNNTWTLLQSTNGGYTAVYAATAKAAGPFQASVQYPPGSSFTDVLFVEYAAKLDQSLGSMATGSAIAAGLPNPNSELVAEFGNIYGKWSDYTSTSGQTLRANSGAHQGVFLAEGTGQSGTVPANQWGTGIVAVSLLPLAPPPPPPVFQTMTILGGVRYCTLCDKSAGDDSITGLNLLAGLRIVIMQLDASGASLGSVSYIMDSNANISGADAFTINASFPLHFFVGVYMPNGAPVQSLAQRIDVDPIHLQGQGTFHIVIRLDVAKPVVVRGVDWFTGA